MKAVLLYVLWCAGFFVGIWLADVATGWLYDGESYAVWWIIFLFFLPLSWPALRCCWPRWRSCGASERLLNANTPSHGGIACRLHASTLNGGDD